MDIIVLITSCIIILLIVFCSWNIVYENYTTVTTKNLLLVNGTNDVSKSSVENFLARLTTLKTKVNTLNTNVNNATVFTGTATDTATMTTEYGIYEKNRVLINQVFPSNETILRLLTTGGENVDFTASDIEMLIGEASVAFFVKIGAGDTGTVYYAQYGTSSTPNLIKTTTYAIMNAGNTGNFIIQASFK